MAWDSKSSPWDWDNAAFLPDDGRSFGRHGCANELPNEVEMEASEESAGPQSLPFCPAGLGPCLSPLAFRSSSLLSSVSTETSGPNYGGGLDHVRRSYEERINGHITDALFSNGCCRKVEAESVDTLLEQKRLGNINTTKERNKEFLELRRHAIPSRSDEANPCVADRKAAKKMAAGNLSGNPTKIGDMAEQLVKKEEQTGKAGSGGSGDSLICLKLGKRTYFEDTSVGGGSKTPSASTVTSSVPTKKTRGAASGVQTPRCQVEGCKLDLTSAKEYHRRHKVCEQHSKAARVTVASKEQRFCQQCSRFHALSEFDDGKRSCRRRLAGHNERRRKPQPDLIAFSTRMPATFEGDQEKNGSMFEHLLIDRLPFFHHSRIMSNPALFDDYNDFKFMNGKVAWPRMLKWEDQLAYDYLMQGQGMDRQLLLSGLSEQTSDRLLLFQSPKEMMPMPQGMPGQRVRPYFQDSMGSIINKGLTLSSQPGTEVLSALESGTVSASEGLTQVSETELALSLLSSQLWYPCTPEMIPLSNGTHVQKAYPYLQESSATIGQGLSLSCSSGSGVLSVLEAVPVCQGITRVSDSGRALSLLASQSCSCVPVPVPLDFSIRPNMTIEQLIHDNQTSLAQQQMVQEGHQQHFDVTTEKFLSVNSSLQNFSAMARLPTAGGTSMEKEYNGGAFIQGLNDAGKYEGHHMFSLLQGHELKGTQGHSSHAMMPTIDLMQLSSSSQSQGSPMQGASEAFCPGGNSFGDLQVLRSYESCFFDSQQMV